MRIKNATEIISFFAASYIIYSYLYSAGFWFFPGYEFISYSTPSDLIASSTKAIPITFFSIIIVEIFNILENPHRYRDTARSEIRVIFFDSSLFINIIIITVMAFSTIWFLLSKPYQSYSYMSFALYLSFSYILYKFLFPIIDLKIVRYQHMAYSFICSAVFIFLIGLNDFGKVLYSKNPIEIGPNLVVLTKNSDNIIYLNKKNETIIIMSRDFYASKRFPFSENQEIRSCIYFKLLCSNYPSPPSSP